MYYFFLITAIYFLIASIYLSLTVFLGLMTPSKKTKQKVKKLNKFAIVIPAHNEAKIIEKTLNSVKNLDYPLKLYTIFVIADNCTDNTAEIARKAGVICLERQDKEKRGKGFALQWFFEKMLAQNFQFDAFVGIDADTIVSRNLLKAMNERLNAGHKVLTAWYNILEPKRSPTVALAYIGFFLRNLRNKGKNILKCTIPLFGNGMCISYSIIKEFGWQATSITEDREYWAMLHLHGIRVEFVDEAYVLAELPIRFKDYEVPRARWDIGRFRIIKKFFIPFVRLWLKERTFTNFEAILELLVPPFTYFVDLLIIFCGLYLYFLPFPTLPQILGVISCLLTSLVIIVVIIKANLDKKVYKDLLKYGFYFLFWRPFNFLKRYFTKSRTEWIKTKRDL